MFGPNKNSKSETPEVTVATEESSAPQMTNLAPRVATPAAAGRRLPDPSSRRASSTGDSGRKLIVGDGLSLSGEITSCDILVVAGKVEAKLTDGKLLEINESGQFRGSVEIENADIAGRYDGQLVVHGRLTVRSTGRISGMVKYGELEVNAGGQIIGELQVTGGGAGAQAPGTGGFKSASKFTSLLDEDDSASISDEQRKSA
ncbi:MAG: polymer-forming cytoskeletal protein [Alphaproteobacteria bacterium]|nr:polymer-forming cytoskeletal protein [Alphaproteobacteria bacterium]